jgi:hypothetical protein
MKGDFQNKMLARATCKQSFIEFEPFDGSWKALLWYKVEVKYEVKGHMWSVM